MGGPCYPSSRPTPGHSCSCLIVTFALTVPTFVQVRISLIGFLSVATMLIIISTDRLYNMSGKLPSGSTAARVAFAGYLLMAIGNFGEPFQLCDVIPALRLLLQSMLNMH